MCGCSNNYNRPNCNSNRYENLGYANSYVINQTLGTPFSPMQGLENGSMFPELVRPYYPGQSMEEINYLRYGRGGMF